MVWTEGGADGGSADFLSAAMFLFNLLVLMLLSGSLMRVCGVRFENHSDYTACIDDPSTCTGSLCVPTAPVAVPSRMRVARAHRSSHEVAATVSV